MKVAVIGAGAVGTAASRFLSKAGHETHVFEQFTLGHDKGSSHGTSRITRKSYPDAYYSALMEEVYPLWQDLEHEANEQLYVETGLLMFGKDGSEWLRQTRLSLSANHVRFEPLGPLDVARRFHGFHLELDEEALYQPEAGVLRADRILDANIRIAKGSGAQFYEKVPVDSFANGIVHGIPFDAVVVSAGSWTNNHIGTQLQPRMQHFAYFSSPLPPDVPAWIEACEEQFYGLPDYGRGFKVGMHKYGPLIDPDCFDRSVQQQALDEIAVNARLRIGATATNEAFTCLYTVAPNEDFKIGEIDGSVPIYWASPCSGHGFKFSIWFGKLLCDLVEGKKRISDYPRFSS